VSRLNGHNQGEQSSFAWWVRGVAIFAFFTVAFGLIVCVLQGWSRINLVASVGAGICFAIAFTLDMKRRAERMIEER
jgi:hypothetical protein